MSKSSRVEFKVPKEAAGRKLPPPSDLIRPWSGPAPKSLIVDSDNHYPIADKYAEAAKLKFAADIKPEAWANLGDLYDFCSLSRFDKEPDRVFDAYTLQDEFDSAKAYWKEVCRVAKRVEFILGNHEFRLFKTIMANLGFFNLRALEDWHNLAGIPEKVQIHQYGTQRQIGPVWLEHGDQLKTTNPANWAIHNRGGRVLVYGHHHKQAFVVKTVRDERGRLGERIVVGQGHGSDTKRQTYVGAAPNWQQGFTYIETHSGGDVSVHPIIITNGRFSFGGKVYDGRKA